jgi:hypothetical protein
MNNLIKFATEADYSAATLNYPAVSWVVSGDTVHFDKTEPTVNDKVIACAVYNEGTQDPQNLHIYNPYGTSPSTYFSSITINDVAMNPISAQTVVNIEANVPVTVKYGITTTTINDCFVVFILSAGSTLPSTFEFLIPSQVTSIDGLPNNLPFNSLVIEATTPPTLSSSYASGLSATIYVPDESVDAYKSASGWLGNANQIHPISEYQGNLPV